LQIIIEALEKKHSDSFQACSETAAGGCWQQPCSDYRIIQHALRASACRL